MRTYKVEYYTLSKGKISTNKPGNQKQFDDIAYIQCTGISKIDDMLETYYEISKDGIYYYPHITCVTEVRGHCIVEL